MLIHQNLVLAYEFITHENSPKKILLDSTENFLDTGQFESEKNMVLIIRQNSRAFFVVTACQSSSALLSLQQTKTYSLC